MKPHAPHTTPSPQVTITRPVATVIIVIQGTSHIMTEDEARTLHLRLGQALGVKQPEESLRELYERHRRPEPAHRPWQLPMPYQLGTPVRVPTDTEITCAVNQR